MLRHNHRLSISYIIYNDNKHFHFKDLPIQHIHQTRDQLLARCNWILEVNLVDVRDVKADAFGILSIVKHEREDRFVHINSVAYLTYDID